MVLSPAKTNSAVLLFAKDDGNTEIEVLRRARLCMTGRRGREWRRDSWLAGRTGDETKIEISHHRS
jgi:hypothetical protein